MWDVLHYLNEARPTFASNSNRLINMVNL